MNSIKRRMKSFIINLIFYISVVPVRIFRPIYLMFVDIVRIILVKNKICDINLSTQFEGAIDLVGTMDVHLGNDCRIGGQVQLGTEESGRIIIGDDVRINRGTTIFSYSLVSIGSHTLIGEFSSIRDANHGLACGTYIKHQAHQSSKIDIGSDVWIGRGVCILPGVTIGDGAVIGANSVVTKDIPPLTIAVGAPAKVLRERK